MTLTSIRKGDQLSEKQAGKERALDAIAATISRIIRVPTEKMRVEKGSYFFDGGKISIRGGAEILRMELAPQLRDDDPDLMYVEFPTPTIFPRGELARLRYEISKIFHEEGIIWMG